jgi:hypothetical protein
LKSEVMLDFCFIRTPKGDFKQEISNELNQLFGDTIHWYLDAKEEENIEVVIAEVRGMGAWKSEKAVVQHIEENGTDTFWEWLQGYRMNVYPNSKGACHCGN